MKHYKDNYYGSILDPIHGDIKLSEIEKWLISQPIFSRLRNVKQNTFLYYVFPSANHTRFEHSIGVMHVAGKIFDSCIENYATGLKKIVKYQEDTVSLFHDLNDLKEKEELYYQELRIAALLHDIGHGPLSHLFDDFGISKEIFLEIIASESSSEKYLKGFKSLIEANESKVEHEIVSCAFIFYLIELLKKESLSDQDKFSKPAQKIIDSLSAERIVQLIEPDFPNLEQFIDADEKNYTLFFSRIITAFPIDADRMDYLLRDSYFSGVTYGIYDINRVFASFLSVCKDGKKVEITFKENGLDSVLRFVQSRTHLFNQVYFHKTNRAANSMLSYGTKTKKIKLLDSSNNIQDILNFYVENTDEVFLRNKVVNYLTETDIETETIKQLINRKLFKRVYQHKIVLHKMLLKTENLDMKITKEEAEEKEMKRIGDEIKAIKNKIKVKLERLSLEKYIYATVDIFENKTFKDSGKKILIAKKHEDKYVFDSEWESYNTEFRLSSMNVMMIRVYLKRPFQNSQDFKNKKGTILDIIKDEIESLKKYDC